MSSKAELGRALVDPICERVRERLTELEEVILGQLGPVDGGAGENAGVAARCEQREAIRACLEVALAAIENGRGWDELPLVPTLALVEVRRAAEAGEDVGSVLRCYATGKGVFWDFFLREALGVEMAEEERARVLLEASAVLSSMGAQLLPKIGAIHAKEIARQRDPAEGQTATIVKALLDCVPVAADGVAYDFDGAHVGLVATGAGAQRAVSHLGGELGCDHLCLPQPDGVVWAWFQTDDPFGGDVLEDNRIERGVRIAVGEGASGRFGFRATHRQAQATMQVAIWQRQPITRYRDVLLLVPAIQDEGCRDVLMSVYLEPLERAPERNPTLKETLEAYFSSQRNMSATAALLRVDRRTATSRLRAIEECLGFPIHAHAAELEIALRLDRLRCRDPEGLRELRTLSIAAPGISST